MYKQILASKIPTGKQAQWGQIYVSFAMSGRCDFIRLSKEAIYSFSVVKLSKSTVSLNWDVNTGNEIGTLPGHSRWIRSIAISPDGKLLASGSDDNKIKL